MKTLIASFALLMSFSAQAGTGNTGTATLSEGRPLKVCGVVYEDKGEEGEVIKGITNQSIMTSYELIIDRVAEPKGVTRRLINYQSGVFRTLKAGQQVCAVGIQGMSQETRYPTVNLIQWAIISAD